MKKTHKQVLFLVMILIGASSCQKCQTCTKTIGGVAGNFVAETREVCDDQEATTLEFSSSGTTVWSCD
jgi:hypothetical protein